MSVITQKAVIDYLEAYEKGPDLTFTKEVIRTLGLDTRQIFLKIAGTNWPCIIYSCGLSGAKVLVNLKSEVVQSLNQYKNLVNLRFYFKDPNRPNPIAFYISCRISGSTPYNQKNQELFFLSLTFTNTPPDELIWLLGQLLDANEGYQRRLETRIEIDPISIKRLGLRSKMSIAKYQDKAFKCILRDLSFSGTQIIIPAVLDFPKGSYIYVAYDFERNSKPILMTGTVVRYEVINDYKLTSISIKYDEKNIPLEYKMALNDYYKHMKYYMQDRGEKNS